MAMPHSAASNRHAWHHSSTVRCGIKAFPLTSTDRLFWPLAGNITFTSVTEGSCCQLETWIGGSTRTFFVVVVFLFLLPLTSSCHAKIKCNQVSPALLFVCFGTSKMTFAAKHLMTWGERLQTRIAHVTAGRGVLDMQRVISLISQKFMARSERYLLMKFCVCVCVNHPDTDVNTHLGGMLIFQHWTG